jgi:hypothetical protein
MDYTLRAVNNGWIISAPPCDDDMAMPFGDFVFSTLKEAMDWLAARHGEVI